MQYQQHIYLNKISSLPFVYSNCRSSMAILILWPHLLDFWLIILSVCVNGLYFVSSVCKFHSNKIHLCLPSIVVPFNFVRKYEKTQNFVDFSRKVKMSTICGNKLMKFGNYLFISAHLIMFSYSTDLLNETPIGVIQFIQVVIFIEIMFFGKEIQT